MTALRDIPITTADSTTTSLARYDGMAVMVVNVASRCGLAPQYATLEKLQRTYGSRGFTVVGFPSNQFFQELSSNEAIQEFCSTTYGVTFPVFDRIRVNGRRTHPLYVELKQHPDADGQVGRVKWNFEKFLISPTDRVQRFRSHTQPDDPAVIAALEAALAERIA